MTKLDKLKDALRKCSLPQQTMFFKMYGHVEDIDPTSINRATQQIEATLLKNNSEMILSIIDLGKKYASSNSPDFTEPTIRFYSDLMGFIVNLSAVDGLELESKFIIFNSKYNNTTYIDLRDLDSNLLNELKLLFL